MKLRQGFVSNSSSSSFIIAVSAVAKCNVCGRSDMNVLDMLNGKEDDNTGYRYLTHRGHKEVIEGLRAELKYYENDKERTDSTNALIDKITKAVKEGKEVAALRIPYNDNYLEIIKCMGNIEIIESENE